MSKQSEMLHKKICDEIHDLYVCRSKVYGESFHQSFVERGMEMPRVLIGDKFSRFNTLTFLGVQNIKGESIRDTLMDLINYALMTVVEMDMRDGNADVESENN